MSAIANILTSGIADSASLKTTSATIGYDKTWVPQGFILPGVAKWVDRSGGIPIGYPSLTVSNRLPTKASRLFKVTVKLTLPTLEQTSASTASGIQPAPTKAYDCSAIMEFLLPERSTSAERLALYCHVMSLFATTISASDGAPTDATGTPMAGLIVNLDQPY